MSVQLSGGSLAAILNGEIVKSPILQVLQLRRVNGNDEKEHHQLILSDGIYCFGLCMLGTHLNILIANEDIQKLTVVKVNKYLLKSVLEKRKEQIIFIMDLAVICKGNQIGHVIGNPTRIVCSSDTEQRTEENISEKTKVAVRSTHEPGPSSRTHSTSTDPVPFLPKEVWAPLKSQSELLILGASHMKIMSSPDLMQSPSQKKVDENTKSPEVSTMPIASTESVSTSEERVDENCLPIFSLTPYMARWTIKAWVSNKSSVHYWKNKQGKTFTVDLIDESGEIRAVAYNECCDIFCDMFETNKSYYISNCKVVATNRKFTSIKYEYQLIFTENTKITPSNESPLKMPSTRYNFQPIGNICSLPVDSCIDVLGLCKSVLDVGCVQTNESLNEIKKQNVTLVDSTNKEIMLTLWESDASRLSEYHHQVIAIKGAKISEFMGMRNIHLTSSSSLKINPDIPVAHELIHWFQNIGCTQLSTSVSTSLGGEEAQKFKTLHDLEICDLRKEHVENFNCSAYVVIIKSTNVIYKACPTLGCNKKLAELGNSFWCDNCEKELISFEWRIILSVKIGDCTNQVWITCFHDEAERLLSVTADELAKISELDNQEAFGQVFENAKFRYFNFTLRKRLDNYKGEERFKVVAVRVRRLNYIEHNRKLIQELRFKQL